MILKLILIELHIQYLSKSCTHYQLWFFDAYYDRFPFSKIFTRADILELKTLRGKPKSISISYVVKKKVKKEKRY